MKSKKYFFITYSYYFILFSLIFLYLFPGSLLGYLFYGDFGKQPQLVPNYLGSFINHYLAFFTTSILGLINDKVVLWKRASFLIFLSIILEFCHTFIPAFFHSLIYAIYIQTTTPTGITATDATKQIMPQFVFLLTIRCCQ